MSSEVQHQIEKDFIGRFPVQAFARAHVQQCDDTINVLLCHIAQTSLF